MCIYNIIVIILLANFGMTFFNNMFFVNGKLTSFLVVIVAGWELFVETDKTSSYVWKNSGNGIYKHSSLVLRYGPNS